MAVIRNLSVMTNLGYILKGRCRKTYDNKVLELEAGDIVCFDAERPHSVEALEPMEFINFYLRQIP